MSKPTVSKDGKKRIGLFVRFRVDLNDIADAAALKLHWYGETWPTNRNDALEITRHALWKSGSSMWADADDVPKDIRDEARRIATDLFPDLV